MRRQTSDLCTWKRSWSAVLTLCWQHLGLTLRSLWRHYNGRHWKWNTSHQNISPPHIQSDITCYHVLPCRAWIQQLKDREHSIRDGTDTQICFIGISPKYIDLMEWIRLDQPLVFVLLLQRAACNALSIKTALTHHFLNRLHSKCISLKSRERPSFGCVDNLQHFQSLFKLQCWITFSYWILQGQSGIKLPIIRDEHKQPKDQRIIIIIKTHVNSFMLTRILSQLSSHLNLLTTVSNNLGNKVSVATSGLIFRLSLLYYEHLSHFVSKVKFFVVKL